MLLLVVSCGAHAALLIAAMLLVLEWVPCGHVPSAAEVAAEPGAPSAAAEPNKQPLCCCKGLLLMSDEPAKTERL